MADMIKFQQGLLSSLSSKAIANGTLWFTTDEGAIYLDTEGKRVRFGDYVMVNNVAALPTPATGQTAYETVLYYAKAENVLARWDNTNRKWIQINAAGLSEIHIEGSGNVLSGVDVVINPTTGAKRLQFTTASVATSEGLSNLTKTVQDLDAAYKKADSDLAKDIGTAQTAADNAGAAANTNAQNITNLGNNLQGQINTINTTIGDASSGMKKDIADLKAADTAIGTRIDGVESAYKAADTALRQELTGNNSGTGAATGTYKTIDKLSAQLVAAESNIGTLSGTVSGHTSNITTMQTNITELQNAVGTGGSVETQINSAVDALRREIVTEGALGDNIQHAYDTITEIAEWLGSDDLAKDADTIISELNTLNNTVGNASSGLIKDVADLKAADTTIRGEFADADTALEKKLAAGTDGTSTFATGNYKTINKLSEQLVIAESDIDTLQSDLSTLSGTVGNASSGLVKDVADLKAADTTIRGEFVDADTTLKNLIVSGEAGTGTYKNINKLSEQLVTAESNIGTLQSNYSTLSGTVNGHTSAIADINTLLTWGTF